MKTVLKIPSIILIAFAMSCGSVDFGGETKSSNGSDSTKNKIDDGVITDAKCPKRPQEILILDFKSGWWAGDGGNFFNTLLTALTSKCYIRFEYHHIIYGGGLLDPGTRNIVKVFPDHEKEEKLPANVENGFHQKDWNKYTQIWFLSGSSADLADLTMDDEFFKDILEQMATRKRANLFIGAGYGSITHSNALLEKLGISTRFATDLEEGRLLNPAGGIKVKSTLQPDTHFDKTSPIFDHIREIADHVEVDGELAGGDYLTSYPSDMAMIGKNTEGKPSFGTMTDVERRMFFDGGLQRYYAVIPPTHEGTYELLRNIIRYLAD